ncbi:MAG: uracil-DNA glycosylase [Candidatus Omnitrophica bacterium]|nr:uracil-DNA glycosylase [Candidatus Omnitrophota bacterium]
MPSKPTAPTQEPQPFIKNLRRPDETLVQEKQGRLDQLAKPLQTCEECRLCQGRTNLVYGVGNPDADLMFVGEGPGRDEDLQGEPFVGRAGKLLTDMIQKGMKIRREDVYIANIVKCRPPDNRNPEPDEMEACLPNLIEQVRIVDPKIIVCLGATAVKGLLKERMGITKLRGNWRTFEGIPVMPTLHPAYLLRNPPAKKDAWEDLKQVIAVMNGEIQPNSS